VVGGLLAGYTSRLKAQAGQRLVESREHVDRYLQAPGGSAEARAHNDRALQKFLEADELERRGDSAGRRLGSKIPIAGSVITGAGVLYDISQGKPIVKSVVSGVGGSLAAGAAGAFSGVKIGASFGVLVGGPAGAVVGAVVGTVAGAGLGLIAGVGASAAIDVGYDHLPKGLKDAIESGDKAIRDGLGNVGEAVGDGVRSVWDAIF
jgi:hypothetical protein